MRKRTIGNTRYTSESDQVSRETQVEFIAGDIVADRYDSSRLFVVLTNIKSGKLYVVEFATGQVFTRNPHCFAVADLDTRNKANERIGTVFNLTDNNGTTVYCGPIETADDHQALCNALGKALTGLIYGTDGQIVRKVYCEFI